jgi:hypothetical protein
MTSHELHSRLGVIWWMTLQGLAFLSLIVSLRSCLAWLMEPQTCFLQYPSPKFGFGHESEVVNMVLRLRCEPTLPTHQKTNKVSHTASKCTHEFKYWFALRGTRTATNMSCLKAACIVAAVGSLGASWMLVDRGQSSLTKMCLPNLQRGGLAVGLRCGSCPERRCRQHNANNNPKGCAPGAPPQTVLCCLHCACRSGSGAPAVEATTTTEAEQTPHWRKPPYYNVSMHRNVFRMTMDGGRYLRIVRASYTLPPSR